MVKNMFLI